MLKRVYVRQKCLTGDKKRGRLRLYRTAWRPIFKCKKIFIRYAKLGVNTNRPMLRNLYWETILLNLSDHITHIRYVELCNAIPDFYQGGGGVTRPDMRLYPGGLLMKSTSKYRRLHVFLMAAASPVAQYISDDAASTLIMFNWNHNVHCDTPYAYYFMILFQHEAKLLAQ